MFLANARSIFPKIDELRSSVDALGADITVITESWLQDSITDDLLLLNNCEFFRSDRKVRRGGGVCIWTNQVFRPREIQPLSDIPHCIEALFVRVSCINFFILCCAVYIPPSLSVAEHKSIFDFLTYELDNMLAKNPNDKLIITGDMNDFSMDTLADSFDLHNRVADATRGTAILDHIWTNDFLTDFYQEEAEVGPPLKNSDHNSIMLSSKCGLVLKDNPQLTLVWDFRKSNENEFLRRLEALDFSPLMVEGNVDTMCIRFYELISKAMEAIPYEYVTFTRRDKPWMTPVLKSLINKRWRAFREKNWNVYNHYKAKVKLEIPNARKKWTERQMDSTRGLWNVVKDIRGSCYQNPWRHLLDESGSFEALLQGLTTEFSKGYNLDDDSELLPLSSAEWGYQISALSVKNQLSRLSCRKATGPDDLPARLLKTGAHILCHPLACIFNFSIRMGVYPSCFKLATVCPIPKLKNPRISDFRPISLLSCISKVFERLVLHDVRMQLQRCYGPHQHAYRNQTSTTTALAEVCEHVSRGLDSRSFSHVNIYCLDLSRAFDKLQPNRLLNHLRSCGAGHGFLRWLQSYLCGRSFRVRVCNIFGPTTSVTSGVPQGSVLGPFLFAAFMGIFSFDRENVFSVIYADDVTLVEHVPCHSTSSISLDQFVTFFKTHGLFVNASKCKRLCIHRAKHGHFDDGRGFSNVSKLKILGVTFTDHFTWTAQISEILKLASQRLHVIRCLKDFVSAQTLIRVYHALITSLFLYASPVYGQLPATLLSRLEGFQRRAHRLICGCSCACDGFPELRGKLEDNALRLLLASEVDEDHPLHGFVPKRLPSTKQFRLPVCRTTKRLNSLFLWAPRISNMDV